MASISKLKNGRKRLQFIDEDGARKAVRLGEVSETVADKIAGHVEALLSAKRLNETPDEKVRKWLAGLDFAIYEKLAAVGPNWRTTSRPGSRARGSGTAKRSRGSTTCN